jgi:L-rhamnose isomerase
MPFSTGGCGDSGRLDEEAARAMHVYQQPVVLFRDAGLVERVLAEVAAMMGGGGGGGAGGEGGEAAAP